MQIAIVSDIHANRFALDTVLADLREPAPGLIFHGGDLPHGGADPAYVVDHIRDLELSGVPGNADEMLFRPESLTEIASHSPKLQPMFAMIAEMAWDREVLGKDRLNWMSTLPLQQLQDSLPPQMP